MDTAAKHTKCLAAALGFIGMGYCSERTEGNETCYTPRARPCGNSRNCHHLGHEVPPDHPLNDNSRDDVAFLASKERLRFNNHAKMPRLSVDELAASDS